MNEAQSLAAADASIYMAITGRAPVLLKPTKPVRKSWLDLPRKCMQFLPRISQQTMTAASVLFVRPARKTI